MRRSLAVLSLTALLIGCSTSSRTSSALERDPAPPAPTVATDALSGVLLIPDDAPDHTIEPASSAALVLLDAILGCTGESSPGPTASISSIESRVLRAPDGASVLVGRASQHRSAADASGYERLHDPALHGCVAAAASPDATPANVAVLTPGLTPGDLLLDVTDGAVTHRFWFGAFAEFRSVLLLSVPSSALAASQPAFTEAIRRLVARAGSR